MLKKKQDKIIKAAIYIGRVYKDNLTCNEYLKQAKDILITCDNEKVERIGDVLFESKVPGCAKENIKKMILLAEDDEERIIIEKASVLLEKLNKLFPNISQHKVLEVCRKIQKIDNQAVFIKGVAWVDLYEKPYERYLGDVDVLLSDLKYMLKLVQEMAYEYQGNRLKTYTGINRKCTYSLDLEAIDVWKNPDIDIHISPYYIFGGNFLYKLTEKRVSYSFGVNVPSYEDMLIISLVHMINHWGFTIKDLNDIYLLISKCKLNWKRVKEKVSKMNLEEELKVISTYLKKYYKIDILKYIKIKFKGVYGFGKCFAKFGGVRALPLCISWSFRQYRKKTTFVKSIKYAIENSMNMIKYNCRAFNIMKKSQKWVDNDVLVLYCNGECKDKASVRIEEIVLGTEILSILNSGVGEWRLGSYHM